MLTANLKGPDQEKGYSLRSVGIKLVVSVAHSIQSDQLDVLLCSVERGNSCNTLFSEPKLYQVYPQ